MIQATEKLSPLPPPAHPLTYPNNVWTCPTTGVPVPKTTIDNVALRVCIWEEHTRRKQEMWMAAFKASPLLWLNLCWWTYRPKFTCEDGIERSAGTVYTYEGKRLRVPPADAPLITWPAQDTAINALLDVCHNGGTLLIDKGRDQGATVICMGTFAWALLFWPRFSAMVASRKEDLVDGNTEDALLGKVDHGLKKLPAWMFQRHRLERSHMLMQYGPTGSRLIGESANDDIGQSLRTTVAFIDEASRFPYQGSLQKSVESVAAGTVFCSTPDGPGTVFSQLRTKADQSDRQEHIKVATLGYWDHPQKGLGREFVIDHDGTVTGMAGKGYWETPAFKVARAKSTNARDYRENWLIDHETSGMIVLDLNAISMMRASARPPEAIGTLRVAGMHDNNGILRLNGDGIANAQKTFKADPKGRLRLWCKLVNGEPARDRNYVLGWDFSQGVEGSNTVCEVMDRETGQIVAEFASPTIAPDEAAAMSVALGTWFGGQLGWAFTIFEANGPGLTFGSTIVRLGYPYLYHQRQEETEGRSSGTRWGWWSTANSKEILFGQLNMSLRSRQIDVPNLDALADMSAWIYDDSGRIICGSHRDASTGAQARHGDRAIALGLCVMGRSEAPRYQPQKPRYKPGTFGAIAHMNMDDDETTSRRKW